MSPNVQGPHGCNYCGGIHNPPVKEAAQPAADTPTAGLRELRDKVTEFMVEADTQQAAELLAKEWERYDQAGARAAVLEDVIREIDRLAAAPPEPDTAGLPADERILGYTIDQLRVAVATASLHDPGWVNRTEPTPEPPRETAGLREALDIVASEPGYTPVTGIDGDDVTFGMQPSSFGYEGDWLQRGPLLTKLRDRLASDSEPASEPPGAGKPA